MGTEPRIRFLPSEANPSQIEWNGTAVHSRNPEQEAKRLAASLLQTRPALVFCFGPGLAFLVEELLRTTNQPIIWIEESQQVRDAALLRLMPVFRELGLSERTDNPSSEPRRWVSNSDLRLLLYSRTPTIAHLKEATDSSLESTACATIRATLQPAYISLASQLERIAFQNTVNRNTLQRFDRIWVKNAYYNFAQAERFLPVNLLTGRFAGMPAVVASAGPSLDQVLPVLHRFRDRFLLLAVDTALSSLAHSGIDPDFVLSVDAQPVNYLHARAYRGNGFFVIDPTVSYLLLRHSTRKVFVFENRLPLVAGLFNTLTGPSPGPLLSGGSVSTNAYDLAMRMGCGPVYLCGLDLAFPGLHIHARGSALEEAAHARTSRLERITHQNYRQLTAIDRRYLPGKGNALVPTNDKLQIFFEWYSRKFREPEAHNRVQNIHGGGAWFPEIQSPTPDSFAMDLQSRAPIQLTIRKEMAALEEATPLQRGHLPEPMGPIRHALADLLADLEAMLPLLGTMEGQDKIPEDQDRRIREIEQRIAARSDLVRMLSNGMQATYFASRQSMNTEDAESIRSFYTALRDACSFHLSIVEP